MLNYLFGNWHRRWKCESRLNALDLEQVRERKQQRGSLIRDSAGWFAGISIYLL